MIGDDLAIRGAPQRPQVSQRQLAWTSWTI
jgi:hypothetical protein